MEKQHIKKEDVENALFKMSAPAGCRGFFYIVDAILLMDAEENKMIKVCKMYEKISKVYGTKPANVERSIRHCLENIRSYGGNPEVIDRYIGMDNCENSNSLYHLLVVLRQEKELPKT